MYEQERTVLAYYINALITADYDYKRYSDDIDVLEMCRQFVDQIDEFINND